MLDCGDGLDPGAIDLCGGGLGGGGGGVPGLVLTLALPGEILAGFGILGQ